jgi:hypothetical protein
VRLISVSFLSAFLLAATTGCAGFYSAPVVPAIAFVYTNVEAPLDINYDETEPGSKTGRASASSILGLVATGDASARAAARDGNITKIRHADYHYMSVLGLYTQFTTIVTGD